MTADRPLRDMPKGRWWIVWIDHVAPSTTSVHVAIAPLPYGPLSRIDFGEAVVSKRIVLVDVSALPIFGVGDIITDRRMEASASGQNSVASICDQPDTGETCNFDLDTSTLGLREQERRSVPVRDFSFDLADGANVRLERLATSRNSSVMMMRSVDERWFLVPAAETLRSFMAPSSMMMSGLFGQTLSNFLASVLRHPEVHEGTSHSIAFGLVEGYGRSHAPFVANLIVGYNPTGARAGASVHASLHEPDPALEATSAAVAWQGMTVRSSALPVCFPFGAGTMTIKAKCLPMGNDTFLVCKIIGGSWPPMPGFVLMEEIGKRDDDLPPTFRRVFVTPSRRHGPAQGESEEGAPSGPVSSTDDIALKGAASPFGEPQQVQVEPLGWSNKPEISTRRIAVQRPPVEIVPEDDLDLDGVAFGASSPIGTRAPGTVDRSPLTAPERFQQASRSLDRLVAGGRIFSQENIAEADVVHAGKSWLDPEVREGLDVWVFPASETRGWTMMRAKDGGHPRPRSLFIRKAVSNDLEPFYWFSIEGRGEDRYGVLLITFKSREAVGVPGAPQPPSPLLGVIDQLSSLKGRIADAAEFFSGLRNRPGRAVVFDHRWTKPSVTVGAGDLPGTGQDAGGDPAPSVEFDDEAVMRAVDSLLSPPDL